MNLHTQIAPVTKDFNGFTFTRIHFFFLSTATEDWLPTLIPGLLQVSAVNRHTSVCAPVRALSMCFGRNFDF